MSTTEIQTHLPAGTWEVDATHSQVGFAVEYLVGTFRGSFSPVEATLAVAEDGTVELTGSADAASIKVQDENLTAHLLSPDFFDAEKAPKITFAASDITLSGRNVEATGELTINNISKPVELTGTFAPSIVDGYGNERIGLTLETVVDRTEFDLNWNLALPTGEPALGNDVTINAELFFVKAQA
jgi:polyisoprenoid-binding protein YceI